MEDGGADFADELVFGVGDEFAVFLEDEDFVGEAAGVGGVSFGEGGADVEAEEEFVVFEFNRSEFFGGWAVADFDGDFIQGLAELVGELGDGALYELLEMLLADMVRHVVMIVRMLKRLTLSAVFLMSAAGLGVLGGCGNPSFLVTPVYPSADLGEVTVQPGPKDAKGAGGKIAIVELEGMILNARTGGMFAAQENPVNRFAEALTRAADDDEVKAVVLRINSPGGGVSASDTLYEEVKRFRAKTNKPVIASVQDIGASGAYYVACASDAIVVTPTSIVGSIGVIFETFNVSGAMAKLGVSSDAIKSATNKDAGSPFRPMTADERAIFQNMIDTYYARFKGIVLARKGGHIPADKTGITFDGRVFTGDDAVALGLADRTGQLRDALDLARTMANVPRAKAVMYRLPFSEQGSIYAASPVPPAQANTYTIKVPAMADLPPGFYYLWQP